MAVIDQVTQRSQNLCEICGSDEYVGAVLVEPKDGNNQDDYAAVCKKCDDQMTEKSEIEPHHWHCLETSVWHEVDAVKVLSWRMLKRLESHIFAQNIMDSAYFEDDVVRWAEQAFSGNETSEHKDSNGTMLFAGDNVSLIKSLNVKGASLTAKRGTPVRNISLVPDNIDQIEGRVEGQQIVILTKFVKKM